MDDARMVDEPSLRGERVLAGGEPDDDDDGNGKGCAAIGIAITSWVDARLLFDGGVGEPMVDAADE